MLACEKKKEAVIVLYVGLCSISELWMTQIKPDPGDSHCVCSTSRAQVSVKLLWPLKVWSFFFQSTCAIKVTQQLSLQLSLGQSDSQSHTSCSAYCQFMNVARGHTEEKQFPHTAFIFQPEMSSCQPFTEPPYPPAQLMLKHPGPHKIYHSKLFLMGRGDGWVVRAHSIWT